MIRLTAILLSTLLLLTGCKKETEEPVKPKVTVKVGRAASGEMKVEVEAPATVFAREQASIASRLTAPVRELRVRKGDSVAAGQVLARLENRDLLAQRAEAAAAVADNQAMLEKTVSGTVPADVERARGQVATTAAALNLAQKNYERRKELFDQGAIPNRDLLASQAELATAKANSEVAIKSMQLLQSQSNTRDIEIARSKLDQAKSRLALIDAQVSYSDIRSPFAGTVTDQFVYPGDMAKPDAPMFTVADLSIAIARAQVPEDEARSVKTGQVCELQPSDNDAARLAGRITVVNQAVDPARRTVEVWCEIPNGGRKLRAGVFGTLHIQTETIPNAVHVPLPAVQFDEDRTKGVVMVVEAGKAKRREVKAGVREGGEVRILDGLKPGETIITEGGYGLPDGVDVTEAPKQ